MALTNKEIAIRVRNLLTEKSPAFNALTIPHISGLIPTALELWTREAASDPDKQSQLTKLFSVPLTAGSLDLTPYTDGTSGKISLDALRGSTLYTLISGVRKPFTWVGSQAQLNAQRLFGQDRPAAFLEGTMLRTRNIDGSQTSLGTASIEFEVLNYPSGASDLPPGLVGDFILYLANLASKEKFLDQ